MLRLDDVNPADPARRTRRIRSPYDGVMERLRLDEDETRVVAVTPVARGVAAPLLLIALWSVATAYGARHYSLVHRVDALLVGLVVVPSIVVLASRTWRWRSHKIHVTSKRIVVEGGVVHHFRSAIALRDVLATRVEQSWGERLVRRGSIVIDTPTGAVLVSRLRHPGALCRLIDAQRAVSQREQWPLEGLSGEVGTMSFPDSAGGRRRRRHR